MMTFFDNETNIWDGHRPWW